MQAQENEDIIELEDHSHLFDQDQVFLLWIFEKLLTQNLDSTRNTKGLNPTTGTRSMY